MFFRQKIDLKAIVGNAGMLLYVPSLMTFCSLPIALFFKEYFAIIPLLITGIVTFLLAYIFYRVCFRPKEIHLWDAMLSAALGWIFCPLFGTIPYLWISYSLVSNGESNSALEALSTPLNAFFETFSGFTSTGLTMIKEPSKLPHILQWWRAFTQWVGGVGLIVFVISFLHPSEAESRLFYAETRYKELGKSLLESGRMIWLIYTIYSLIFIGLFFITGMPLWESICHTLSAISTGGFTISSHSFAEYSPLIKRSTIVLMVIGAMSFTIHYKLLFERDFSSLWKDIQNRILYIFFVIGSILVYLFAFPYFDFLDATFQWVTSLATCGFSTKNLSVLHPLVKVFLVVGMVIGGSSGSTVGGIKIRRVIYLWQAIILRLKSFTLKKEKKVLEESKLFEPTGVDLPEGHKTERLFEASILFTLWMFSLAIGWILLSLFLPNLNGVDLLFEVSSALSNVGLSIGIVGPEISAAAKFVFIFIMWMGRLEVIPILILFLSPFVALSKKKS